MQVQRGPKQDPSVVQKERREENITTGRTAFENELKHATITMASITTDEVLPFILRKVRFGTLDELYAAIGYGGTTASKAVARIKDELLRLGRLNETKMSQSGKTTAESMIVPQTVSVDSLRGSNKHSDSGIIVEGLGNCTVKFAKCCTPVPGDSIVGFITKGFGVSVHRVDCPNTIGVHDPAQAARWVRVRWDNVEEKPFNTTLELDCLTRDGLLLDVAMVMTSARVRVKELVGKDLPGGHSVFTVRFEVKNTAELETIRNRLMSIRDVMGSRRGQN